MAVAGWPQGQWQQLITDIDGAQVSLGTFSQLTRGHTKAKLRQTVRSVDPKVPPMDLSQDSFHDDGEDRRDSLACFSWFTSWDESLQTNSSSRDAAEAHTGGEEELSVALDRDHCAETGRGEESDLCGSLYEGVWLSDTACVQRSYSPDSDKTAPWGPSHGRQSSMDFSNMSPSHGLQFFTNCSSVGPFHGVPSFRTDCSSVGPPRGHKSCQQTCSSVGSSLPTGPQALPGACSSVGFPRGHKSCQQTCSSMGSSLPTGPQALPGACSSVGFPRGHSLLWASTCFGVGSSTGCSRLWANSRNPRENVGWEWREEERFCQLQYSARYKTQGILTWSFYLPKMEEQRPAHQRDLYEEDLKKIILFYSFTVHYTVMFWEHIDLFAKSTMQALCVSARCFCQMDEEMRGLAGGVRSWTAECGWTASSPGNKTPPDPLYYSRDGYSQALATQTAQEKVRHTKWNTNNGVVLQNNKNILRGKIHAFSNRKLLPDAAPNPHNPQYRDHCTESNLIQTTFKYLQGWRLNQFPGQPVPMLDNAFSEVKFPNIQSKPPLVQPEAISSRPITCYLEEQANANLATTSFQVVVESKKVSPQPPLLQAKHHHFPQPLLIRLLLQTLHQLRCPSLGTLQHLNVSLVVRGPKLNTVVEGHNHFPSPAGHTIFDTSQDAIGLLGHLGTLLAHIQAAVNQHSQVLLCRAALQPLFPKPVVLHGVAVAQVQDPTLGLVKPHTVGPSPSIQPVQVPLQSLPTLQQINTPAQLGVICKLTEGALDPFVQIIDKDVKQNWPQHRALGNTTCDRPPTGVNSIHHHSLGPAVQPVLYPAKSTPVQAMSSQFLQENAVGNRVKGFTEV
ncbi:hypothetical protein QYF61_016881 [Mycteria americana]|uniref:Uncharacterized protein n=1 Tax=Mycteria americana TaxID=33587 RepID=A0AAN7S160_MYCAM|nr:hypothetical protein QYF61_016881 [Mycteria americana]